jgi:F-box and leucine-rich repeat protein GRR1
MQDFNTPQRQAFCVFSCKGVSQLRTYLTELFDRITEMNNTDDTEYEEDDFDTEAYQEEDTPEPEFFGDARDIEGYPRQNILINPIMTTPRGGSRTGPSAPGLQQPSHEFTFQLDRPIRAPTFPTDDRDGRQMGEISPSTNLYVATSRLNAQITASTPTLQPRLPRGHTQLIRSVADVLPVVESPVSPIPSDVSNHSIGTNSNGAGFFRVYHERPTLSVSPQGYGALTPDLNYAEIGHGRGAQPGPIDTSPIVPGSFVRASTRMLHNSNHDRTSRQPTIAPLNAAQEPSRSHSSQGSSESDESTDRNAYQNISTAADKSRSYHEPSLTAPATRELQGYVQSAPGVERRGRREQPESTQKAERRARSVKRSLRNTFHAAEHYASSLLFGRNSEDTIEGNIPGSGMASGSRSYPSGSVVQ